MFARVEPEIKEQAEHVLSQLGIPMSNAIGLFLRQIIMHRGIPFEMKLPAKMPVENGGTSTSVFNAELEKEYADVVADQKHDFNAEETNDH